MATTITLVATVMFGSDGMVDEDASVEAFRDQVINYKTQQETEDESIAEAVHAVFDEPGMDKGVALNTPFVVRHALAHLNSNRTNEAYLSDRVSDYLRRNNQGKKNEDDSVERPNSLFVVGRGKGAAAGVRRRADIPEPTPVAPKTAKTSK